MPRKHRIYEKDFREEAVNPLLSSGRPLKRVAAELGISSNSLRTWRDQALGNMRGAEALRRSRKAAVQRPLPMRRGRSAARNARSITSAASARS